MPTGQNEVLFPHCRVDGGVGEGLGGAGGVGGGEGGILPGVTFTRAELSCGLVHAVLSIHCKESVAKMPVAQPGVEVHASQHRPASKLSMCLRSSP